ncbi:hypothetical protein DYB32_008803 [Aphanomyces invadans]|uniref:UBC core domain-containing protein n=1 Tax=Aphanomyces invadans TaxID=157072 RepID=A0A3R6ZJJ7_9STRA|nr:hypothetical protein DYB32_008803 [Aphanomyces invadans]
MTALTTLCLSLIPLLVEIQGPEGTPYEKGIFLLSILIPERYPFEPPKVQFTTPIFHPNIDNAGRICLDTLKGSWMPSVNLSTLLTTIRLLMAEPNPDDGLMPEIVRSAMRLVHSLDLYRRISTSKTTHCSCRKLLP